MMDDVVVIPQAKPESTRNSVEGAGATVSAAAIVAVTPEVGDKSTPPQLRTPSDAVAVDLDAGAVAGSVRQQQSLSSGGGPSVVPSPPPAVLISSADPEESVNVESTSGGTGNGLSTGDSNHTDTATSYNFDRATASTNTAITSTIPVDSTSTPNSIHHHQHPEEEDDVDMSMTQEGEVTMAERTLVEDGGEEEEERRALTHVKGPSSSSGPRSALLYVESVQHGDPLRRGEEEEEGEKTVATEVLEIGGEKGPSRRPSHLRVHVHGPPPTPWDDVDPPYSPGEQKFRTLQNAGNGARPLIPKSSYYFGPPGPDSAYGTPPIGQIGVHHPREVLRIERDYTGGELIQFAPIYPLELDGRLTPTQFLESINSINEILISAHSLRHSMLDHMLAIFSLQISRLFVRTHFDKEMERLRQLIEELNAGMYNPVGLNILWPRDVAFLYLEIEYY